MKSLFKYLLVFCLFPAQAFSAPSPRDFVKSLTDVIMAKVVTGSAPLKQRQETFRSVFTNNADMDTITKFVLGRSYKSASEEERQAFSKAFTDSVILTWTSRFMNYAGTEIVFQDTRQDKNDYYVTSSMTIPNSDSNINLIWRVRDNGGQLKLVDIVAEGVSMIQTYRTEYASVLQQNDGDVKALIKILQDKNKELAANPSPVSGKK